MYKKKLRAIILLLTVLCCSIQTSKAAENAPGFIPGDALEILVAPDTVPLLEGTHPILSDTTVFLPRLGRLKLSALTVDSCAALLNASFIDCLRHPSIRVRPLMRLSMQGGFVTPGLLYISPDLSLWEAIRLAGGTQREDGLKKIRWERRGMIQSRDLSSQIESGVSLAALGFHSGDGLRITTNPRRTRTEILGQTILPILSLGLTAAMVFLTTQQIRDAGSNGN